MHGWEYISMCERPECNEVLDVVAPRVCRCTEPQKPKKNTENSDWDPSNPTPCTQLNHQSSAWADAHQVSAQEPNLFSERRSPQSPDCGVTAPHWSTRYCDRATSIVRHHLMHAADSTNFSLGVLCMKSAQSMAVPVFSPCCMDSKATLGTRNFAFVESQTSTTQATTVTSGHRNATW